MTGQATSAAQKLKIYHPLKTGDSVSIEGPKKEQLAARVSVIAPDGIRLQLQRPASRERLEVGDNVRINYWENWIVYCWDARITAVDGSARELLSVSIDRHGVTIERRRSLRILAAVPFSFVVAEAKKTWLIGKASSCRTLDIGIGGLKFETPFPLDNGDKVSLKLNVSSTQHVSASGWVVRSERIEKGKQNHMRTVAVEFMQINREHQKLLLGFLARLAERLSFTTKTTTDTKTPGGE